MKKRILIIDDSRTIRTFFTLALGDTGCEVYTAESGEKGIEYHKKKKSDLIFVDLEMPSMNGIEAIRQLRKVSPNVPIYIISAVSNKFADEIHALITEGIKFEIIRKPIPSSDIRDVVKSVLEGPIGLKEVGVVVYHFKLYVSGQGEASKKTIEDVTKMFEDEIKEQCSLEVIDLIKYPDLEKGDGYFVFGTPTLVKIAPKPVRRVMGDFSYRRIVLRELGIPS